MSKPHLSDELWTMIEPLIPAKTRRRTHSERLPGDARRCLADILYMCCSSGVPWAYLPREFGCGGMTCWRRSRDWQNAGVQAAMHRLMLDHLHAAEKIDWSRAVNSSSIRAVGGPN